MVGVGCIASAAFDAYTTVNAGPAVLRYNVHRWFEAERVVPLVAHVAHEHLVVVSRMSIEREPSKNLE